MGGCTSSDGVMAYSFRQTNQITHYLGHMYMHNIIHIYIYYRTPCIVYIHTGIDL